MKNAIQGLVTILSLLAVLPPMAQSQWTRLMSLEGILVQDFEISESGVLYALPSSVNEFYVSTNGGDSWQLRSTPDSMGVRNLEVGGEELYLLADTPSSTTRFYRSSDHGRTFTFVPTERPIWAFCCSSDGKVYGLMHGEDADSVVVSENQGARWTGIAPLDFSLPQWYTEDILSLGHDGSLWCNTRSALLRFDEGMGSWVPYEGGVEAGTYSPTVFHKPNGDVYMNSWCRLLKYDAAADTVKELYNRDNLWPFAFSAIATEDGRLLVSHGSPFGPHSYIQESSDDGMTWRIADSTLSSTLEYYGQHGGRIFAASESVIRRSSDGIAFEECMHIVSTPSIVHFETRGQRVHVMGGRYALSSDGGTSWSYPGIGSGLNPFALQVTSDGIMYENRGHLRISRDSARTWEQPYGWEIEDFLALDDVILVAVTNNTIIRSTDQGRSFVLTNSNPSRVTAFREQGNMLYALTRDVLLRSSDRGVNWTEFSLPQGQGGYRNLIANDRVLVYTVGNLAWTSRTQGEDWEGPTETGLDVGLVYVAVNSDGTFAGIVCRGFLDERHKLHPIQDVVLSTDDGLSWQSIGEGLPAAFFTPRNYIIYSRIGFTDRSRLLVNCEYGLFAYGAVPLSAPQVAVSPEAPVLSAWPTPAHDELAWSLQGMEYPVDVLLIDLAGRVVARSGRTSVQSGAFDVSRLPEGVYLMRAAFPADQRRTTDERMLSKRVVILR